MTLQQVVEHANRKYWLLVLGHERATHFRDVNEVLVLLDAGDDLNLPQPALNADDLSLMVKKSPSVLHLGWSEEHTVSQLAVHREPERRLDDASYRRLLADEACAIVWSERHRIDRALLVAGCRNKGKRNWPHIKHPNPPRIVSRLQPSNFRDLRALVAPTSKD